MLRDLLSFNNLKSKIDIKKVESQKKILNRFDSAGMSLGALSPKAHETLAEAMNTLVVDQTQERVAKLREIWNSKMSKSNKLPLVDLVLLLIILVNAEVLQIKIAQGANQVRAVNYLAVK